MKYLYPKLLLASLAFAMASCEVSTDCHEDIVTGDEDESCAEVYMFNTPVVLGEDDRYEIDLDRDNESDFMIDTEVVFNASETQVIGHSMLLRNLNSSMHAVVNSNFEMRQFREGEKISYNYDGSSSNFYFYDSDNDGDRIGNWHGRGPSYVGITAPGERVGWIKVDVKDQRIQILGYALSD